jgi:uridine kinase
MTKYIAIDGRGGSGKTFLSELLANKLNAIVYHLDDYGNDYYPFIGMSKLVDALGKANDDVVIFEGIGVFDECFDVFEPMRILVQVPEDIRIFRAASRDIPRDDRSADEWKKIGKIWDEAEEIYFNNTVAGKADIKVGMTNGDFDVNAIINKFISC